jgi:hypothetical protein
MGTFPGVWMEVGHTTRAVLDAVCEISSIIHCCDAYMRLDESWLVIHCPRVFLWAETAKLR